MGKYSTQVNIAPYNYGLNVLLFYIRLYTTFNIIQRHYYLSRNILYSNRHHPQCSAELKSFKEDHLNERKEQQAINEALLRNMMRGSSQGKPTQSTNSSKVNLTINETTTQEKKKKRNVSLKLWKEIITVLLVMTFFLRGERNK